jgi:hypothetical protein
MCISLENNGDNRDLRRPTIMGQKVFNRNNFITVWANVKFTNNFTSDNGRGHRKWTCDVTQSAGLAMAPSSTVNDGEARERKREGERTSRGFLVMSLLKCLSREDTEGGLITEPLSTGACRSGVTAVIAVLNKMFLSEIARD